MVQNRRFPAVDPMHERASTQHDRAFAIAVGLCHDVGDGIVAWRRNYPQVLRWRRNRLRRSDPDDLGAIIGHLDHEISGGINGTYRIVGKCRAGQRKSPDDAKHRPFAFSHRRSSLIVRDHQENEDHFNSFFTFVIRAGYNRTGLPKRSCLCTWRVERAGNAKERPMTKDHAVDIALLHLRDAHEFAPLLASYAQALKRGAPRRPDDFYAEHLLQDRAAETLGARVDGNLVGFVIFYDLPEPVTGLRAGQVDHIYVHHDHRGKGIAKALIDVLADKAEERSWSKLVLNAPRVPEDGRKLYEQIATAADWSSYVIRFGN